MSTEIGSFLDWAHARIERAIAEGVVNPPKCRLKNSKSGTKPPPVKLNLVARATECAKAGLNAEQIMAKVCCSYSTAIMGLGRVRGEKWALPKLKRAA